MSSTQRSAAVFALVVVTVSATSLDLSVRTVVAGVAGLVIVLVAVGGRFSRSTPGSGQPKTLLASHENSRSSRRVETRRNADVGGRWRCPATSLIPPGRGAAHDVAATLRRGTGRRH